MATAPRMRIACPFPDAQMANASVTMTERLIVARAPAGMWAPVPPVNWVPSPAGQARPAKDSSEVAKS